MSLVTGRTGSGFDRCNLEQLALAPARAHRGRGEIQFRRIAERLDVAGPCNFIDLAVLPPGTSIGRHRHGADEEEFYLVLDGEGRMWRDGVEFTVRAGDLIRNAPGGTHGLENVGTCPLRLFVFELQVAR